MGSPRQDVNTGHKQPYCAPPVSHVLCYKVWIMLVQNWYVCHTLGIKSVPTCSTRPHSNEEWKAGCHGETVSPGRHSKCFVTKRVREIVVSRMKKRELREREREPQCLSHLHTAGQSRCEVGVNIGFRLHKWLDTVRPNTCQILEKCEGGGVCSYSTSQQEPTDRIYLLAFLIPQWRPSHVLPPFRSRDIWLKNRKGSWNLKMVHRLIETFVWWQQAKWFHTFEWKGQDSATACRV